MRRDLWLLVGVAFAVRILPVTLRFVIGSDEGLFLTLGQNLAAGLGYTGDGITSQVDFPPGYPLFAAAVYRLGGGLELPSKLNLLLFGSLLPLPVYWLARQLAGDTTAFRAGLLVALLPGLALAQGNFEAAAEPLYTLMLYTGWAALWWGLTPRRPLAFLLAGLAIGAAHLARWEGIIFGLLAAGIILLDNVFRKQTMKFWFSSSVFGIILLLTGLGIFAVPYGLYLYQHTGSFVNPKTAITQLHAAALDASRDDPYAFEKYYFELEDVLADPDSFSGLPPALVQDRTPLLLRYSRNILLELRLLFTSLSLMTVLWIIPAALGLWAIGLARALFLSVLFLPLAAIPASVVDPRYFLPALPAAMIFAACGFSWMNQRLAGFRIQDAGSKRQTSAPQVDNSLNPSDVSRLRLRVSRVTPQLASILIALTLILFTLADLAGPFLYPRPTEYRAAGLAVRDQLSGDAHVLARKRQIPFYAGAVWEWLPFAELEGVLDYARAHQADYIVIDRFTAPALRPQLAYLLDPANAPPVLTPIYYDEVGGVVIYRIAR